MMSERVRTPLSKPKTVTIGILILTQLLYLVLGALIMSIVGGVWLGLGLVLDYCHDGCNAIARAILIRAWAIAICSIAFPFTAIIATIVAWYLYSKKAHKKAILSTLTPLFLAICYFLILSWDPYVLH
jgi:hypothetical protein